MIPKYRAWSLTKEMMGEVLALYWRDGKVFSALVDFGDHRSLCTGDTFVLMQGTGEVDKDGKEIWEGDIVCTTKDGEIENREVVFSSGMFRFEYTTLCFSDLKGIGYTLEIIGNIYQNKDLYESR